MKTDFNLGEDLIDSIQHILEFSGSVVSIGVVPDDRRTAGQINESELVCEVTDFDEIPLQANGEAEVGGCRCDDDTRGPCRCPWEHNVEYSVVLNRVERENDKLYAIYEIN